MSAPRGQCPLGLLWASEGSKRQRGPALPCAPHLLRLSAAGKEPFGYPPRPALQWRGAAQSWLGQGRVEWGGAYLSLIRTNTSTWASAILLAPLLQRPARLSFPGPCHRLFPRRCCGPHHDQGSAVARRGPSAPGRTCPSPVVAAGASRRALGSPGERLSVGGGPWCRFPERPAAKHSTELGAGEEQPIQYSALAATVFVGRPRGWSVAHSHPWRSGCGDSPRQTLSVRPPAH